MTNTHSSTASGQLAAPPANANTNHDGASHSFQSVRALRTPLVRWCRVGLHLQSPGGSAFSRVVPPSPIPAGICCTSFACFCLFAGIHCCVVFCVSLLGPTSTIPMSQSLVSWPRQSIMLSTFPSSVDRQLKPPGEGTTCVPTYLGTR